MKKMKLMMLAIAIVFGTSAFANVQSSSSENNATVAISQTNDDGYVEVKLEDLNEKVQAAIKGYAESYDVSALGYNADKKLTRVTLSSKADQSIKVVILDDEGKEYVEATAE
jgi:ABC-type glycerol-3-phosphate transport system substrate-binding protein